MRLLTVCDLHTIRQNPWAYQFVSNELCATCRRFPEELPIWEGLQLKVVMTKNSEIGTDCPYALALPRAAEKALEGFATRWDDAAVAAWCDLMLGRGPIAELYWDVLEWLAGRYGADGFAYWGSNRTVRNFCEANGLRSVALELGPTRPPFRPSRYCDFMGVNGDAMTRVLDASAFRPLNLRRWRLSGGISYDEGQGHDAMFNPLTTRWAKNIYESARPVAILILQLDDDSNCLIHSGYSGMLEMVSETLPRLVEAGWLVLVKPHPGAAPKKGPAGARQRNIDGHAAVRQFVEGRYAGGEALWVDDVPAAEYVSLLRKADAAISVNSSMGFEAMLSGRLVVTLGHAPYNVGDGLPTLDDLLNDRVDRAKYDRYAGQVATVMLKHYLFSGNLLSSPTELARAVWRNAALADAYEAGGAAGLQKAVLANPVVTIDEADFLE